jgi:glycine/D-amino acid oxidase-like deaminating enzyme
MYPHIESVSSDLQLPPVTDVAIIGGGIIGVCAAYCLAARGIDVVLLEKGAIGAEQSSRNWGWCRSMGRDLAEVPLAMASLRLWNEWQAGFPQDLGFRRSGIFYACETPQQLAEQAQWLQAASQFGASGQILEGAELRRTLPDGARNGWAGALHVALDGRAEPHMATARIASAARRQGARLFTRCAVRGIDTQAGRVRAVITEHGELCCSTAILAGGAWSSLFCRNLGIRLPQLKVIASVMRTQPMPGGPEYALGAGNYAFRKRLDGGYSIAQRSANIAPITPDSLRYFSDFLPTLGKQYRELRLRFGRTFFQECRLPNRWALDQISPFERCRVLDPQPSAAILREAQEALSAAFPFFRTLQIQQSWAGVMDITPDAVPVIGPLANLPGLYLASGFSGHGFGIAPGAGHLLADLISGTTPLVDPAPFRCDRLIRP